MSAVGERFKIGRTSYEVIAVARDEKVRTLGEYPTPCVFLPIAQNYSSGAFGMTLVERTKLTPYAMVLPVKRQIVALNRGLAVFNIESMENHVRTAELLPRLQLGQFQPHGQHRLLVQRQPRRDTLFGW